MCKDNAGIPSTLQNVWNEFLNSENLMIILCSSAMSVIEKELLSEKIRCTAGQQGFTK